MYFFSKTIKNPLKHEGPTGKRTSAESKNLNPETLNTFH